ncbi:MAG: glycosyltransferase family 9 protein, partial [Chthoniobacterales bacterium]
MLPARSAFHKPANYLAALATVPLAPVFATMRRFRSGKPAPPPAEWRDAVLIGADHIGDVLFRTVGLDALKVALPECRWHFIASQPGAQLIETHPALESVIVADAPVERRSFADRVALLRSRQFDAAVCYDSGDYWRDQMASASAGIPACVGYSHKGFPGLATLVMPYDRPRPYADRFRLLVEFLTGTAIVGPSRPVVHLTPGDLAAGAGVASRFEATKPLLAVGITGNQPHGEALKERMLETLAALVKTMDVQLVFLGAPDDRAEIEERCRRHRLAAANLCGELKPRESVAFLRHARAAFVVDSGLRHMANAAGIRVVFFRNLFTFREET